MTVTYEDKLKIEINELENLLLDLSNCETLNQFYACIDGKLDAKKKIRDILVDIRKNGGQIPVVNI